LGFEKVFYYKPGKADWLAHGLPAIRENRDPETIWVMDHMQRELPTCRLDEAVGQAGARAEQRGYSVCPVVNENGIVLGVIGKRDWDIDPTASAEQLMDSAPTTLRPSDPLEKAKQLLQTIEHGAVLITDSDGKLLGAFLGAANNEEARRKQQRPQSDVRSG
jgi:CBS domain-containing protein